MFRLGLLAGLLFALVFVLDSAGANAEEKCYTDRGSEVCFPLGVRSFADAVTSFEIGNPASKFSSANIAAKTLGEPNYDKREADKPESPQNYLTLGCGGTLTLQFHDNALIDVPGPDLYVFEIGGHVEATHLAISADGKDWTDVGTVKGGLAAVDIGGASLPGRAYRFVRLQDAGEHCESRWPGADIDAVGAIGSVAVADGRLRVMASDALRLAPSQIGLIFDASGSMWGRLPSGKPKITVAKDAMRSIVRSLPDGSDVGLRIYGHRLPRRPKDASCLDSQLVVPFGPLDRTRIIRAIDTVQPKGQTPIGRSLSLMSQDLADSKGFKLIIVVSDGIETCSPETGDPDFPPDVVRAMKTRGVKFRVNVVGFGIESSETRQFLTRIAETSGGRYIGAGNTKELASAVSAAIELVYLVQDQSGKTVFEGTVGAPAIGLAPGRYSVVVPGRPDITIPNVNIVQDVETRLIIREAGPKPNVEQITVPSGTE